jgi:HD-like signal output (HDOD) protein
MLVDDEATVLKVVKMAMQATITCEILTATSGAEALRILEKERVDVVVCDIGMPVMDGVSLVNVLAELHPEVTRLIFTALRATRDLGLHTAGAAHQFFLKPTSIRALAEKIGAVQRLRHTLPDKGVDLIVAKVRSLPSLPAVYTELEQALGRPDSSMETVGKILEKDVAMSAKVLQLVNSAFFGMHERVTRPSQAAVLLGGEVVKALLLGLHLFTSSKNTSILGCPIQELWRHALAVATGARQIALEEGCPLERADECFAAGLFHDIGKNIIAENLPDSCNQIQQEVVTRGIATLEAEREVLGTTHAEAGAYLMALWGFGDPIVNACAFHHRPWQDPAAGFGTVTAVHAADVIDHEQAPADGTPALCLDLAYLERQGLAARVDAWRRRVAGVAPA